MPTEAIAIGNMDLIDNPEPVKNEASQEQSVRHPEQEDKSSQALAEHNQQAPLQPDHRDIEKRNKDFWRTVHKLVGVSMTAALSLGVQLEVYVDVLRQIRVVFAAPLLNGAYLYAIDGGCDFYSSACERVNGTVRSEYKLASLIAGSQELPCGGPADCARKICFIRQRYPAPGIKVMADVASIPTSCDWSSPPSVYRTPQYLLIEGFLYSAFVFVLLFTILSATWHLYFKSRQTTKCCKIAHKCFICLVLLLSKVCTIVSYAYSHHYVGEVAKDKGDEDPEASLSSWTFILFTVFFALETLWSLVELDFIPWNHVRNFSRDVWDRVSHYFAHQDGSEEERSKLLVN